MRTRVPLPQCMQIRWHCLKTHRNSRLISCIRVHENTRTHSDTHFQRCLKNKTTTITENIGNWFSCADYRLLHNDLPHRCVQLWLSWVKFENKKIFLLRCNRRSTVCKHPKRSQRPKSKQFYVETRLEVAGFKSQSLWTNLCRVVVLHVEMFDWFELMSWRVFNAGNLNFETGTQHAIFDQ